MSDGSGPNLSAVFATYDHDTSSWRTCQRSLLPTADGHSEKFSGTWPRSGTMQNGQCTERETWGPRTDATGSGLLPTPTASEAKGPAGVFNKASASGRSLSTRAHLGMLPTPTANDHKLAGYQGDKHGNWWPTLAGAVGAASMPTPTANDAKNGTFPPSQQERDSLPGELIRRGARGRLSPQFVEWLMGVPIDWTLPCGATEYAHSETRSSPNAPNSSADE